MLLASVKHRGACALRQSVLGSVACLGILAAGLATDSAMAEVAAKVVGLKVASDQIDGDQFSMNPLMGSPTEVQVLLTTDSGGIVSVNGFDSELNILADNTGKDLTKKPKGSDSWNSAGVSGMASISNDGKLTIVDVSGLQAPSAKATSLVLDADIVVDVAQSKKDVSVNTPLKAGPLNVPGHSNLSLGNARMEDGFNGKSLMIEMKAKGDSAKALAGVSIKIGNGKPVEGSARSTMSFGDNKEVDWSFDLPNKPANATLILSFWEGLERVTVPVKLTVDVGVGG